MAHHRLTPQFDIGKFPAGRRPRKGGLSYFAHDRWKSNENWFNCKLQGTGMRRRTVQWSRDIFNASK
jgi:hypothetical protein